MNKTEFAKIKKIGLYTAVTTAAMAIGPLGVQFNRFFYGLCLVLLAIGVYFYIVLAVADKNWLDIRGVFHGVWVLTIGLAALRLTGYQEVWQVKTWLCLAGGYAMFQIGASLGIWLCGRYSDRIAKRVSGFKWKRLSLEAHPNRLFGICVATTLIGLGCFATNVFIKGFIPCFSSDPNAYLNFYTRFHVFAVASTVGSGICYYCIKTQNLARWKKLVLWGCILYLTFLFPIMVVSRGTFVTSALSLTVSVFYLNKKRLSVLICCVILIAGTYVGASMLRGYTDAQLSEFFEPAVIGTEPTDPTDPTSGEEDLGFIFQLSPKVAFVYSYLTVSHDNFNEAVQNSKYCTFGLRQLIPFNVIIRSQWIEDTVENAEYYLVRDHLNTVNVMGDFYYDFHEWGVLICMLLWSTVFGIMQAYADKGLGPIALLVMGNAITPVALNFFSTWTSLFSFWLMWGTALLMAIALYITVVPKKEIKKES